MRAEKVSKSSANCDQSSIACLAIAEAGSAGIFFRSSVLYCQILNTLNPSSVCCVEPHLQDRVVKLHELLKKKMQILEGDKRTLDEQATGTYS